MPRLRRLLAASAAAGSILRAPAVLGLEEADQDPIVQDVQYLWPVAFASVPLATDPPPEGSGEPPGLEDPVLGERLARLGEECFARYINDILPTELEADPAFAAEWRDADASRVNRGFLRWQKRVYAKLANIKVEYLNWDGKPVPELAGVDYAWTELYKSQSYKLLRRRIEQITDVYIEGVKGNTEDFHPYRTFIWAEVYAQGDFQRPHTHTGAVSAGTFVARYTRSKAGAQKVAIEDPRGINPPYGKTHNHQPLQGELLMWPSWVSHMVTPSPANATNVYFSFLTYPPGGARDLDWEDDPTGDYAHQKNVNIKRARGKGADGGESRNTEGRGEL